MVSAVRAVMHSGRQTHGITHTRRHTHTASHTRRHTHGITHTTSHTHGVTPTALHTRRHTHTRRHNTHTASHIRRHPNCRTSAPPSFRNIQNGVKPPDIFFSSKTKTKPASKIGRRQETNACLCESAHEMKDKQPVA